MFKKALDFILERLSQNSTWRGIIMVLTSLGIANFGSTLEGQITAAGMAVVGLINIIRKGEKGLGENVAKDN